MHITVEHIEFKKALEIVARISTKHLTLPILQCILLVVEKGTLTLTSTNLEIGIEATLQVQEKTPGSVAVSASTLLQTISLISQKNIILSVNDGVLIIETPTSKSTINTIQTNEFPSIPRINKKPQIINGKMFSFGIKSSVFSASQSSIKPELGSVYILQKKSQTLTFVATDSFRLMEKTVPLQGVIFDSGILIPYKNATEIAHVCDVLEDNPTLSIDENQCALTFKNYYITSRLTNGSFPDYEQIIPKEYITHTTILTKDLQNALKKTNIFLNKFMQLTLLVKENTITLKAGSGDVGSTTETIPATTNGEDITLSFNQRYVAESLSHIIDESITLNFAGIGRPLVIEGVHDRSLRYLVMPMNK